MFYSACRTPARTSMPPGLAGAQRIRADPGGFPAHGEGPGMTHLTYLQAAVVGLVQGVSELFPVSSLGHAVLIPALIGGQWATNLNLAASASPYLAFIVGLHVATAAALIIYFWRDWVRILRGLATSIRYREVYTADERLAWMIVLGTIPVGIASVALQKTFQTVFGQPKLAAVFLTINGLI